MHPGAPDLQLSAALEQAVARFAAMVRHVGLRHRLSEADLDEVMQEVRLRLWRARGTAEGLERIGSSYVYRTAVSAALDLLRRRRTRQSSAEPLDEVAAAATAGRDPAEELESSELAREVERVIETIPASRRPVVRMHLAGYPREEIAEMMGWTEAKTRNLLYRGLADLRAGLIERGIGLDFATEP
ncbi:MAG TPA: sigma-70 family RNA polymerase sigma factor [Gemmatimonadales bacterium]|nr:sigma-70 family RNA polymerase sigma factor [Gemmatimonadales bacterium]